MNPSQAVSVLNRLLQILSRSLPMYLLDARPWTRREDLPIEGAMARVVADQRTYSQRVIRAIVARGGRPDPGPFPTWFTSANDIEIDYLQQRLIECQRDDVQALRQCVEVLSSEPSLQRLADEALGNAQGHLDILEEMTKHE